MNAIGAAVGLVALATMLAPIAALSVQRHEVVAAADASALAAAAVLLGAAPPSAGSDPCAVASTIAARHRAAIGSCLIDGATVTVTAVVDLPLGSLTALATAGPDGAA